MFIEGLRGFVWLITANIDPEDHYHTHLKMMLESLIASNQN
jgi:hypothetical protein